MFKIRAYIYRCTIEQQPGYSALCNSFFPFLHMICDHYQSPPFPLHSLINLVHLLTARAKLNACWYLYWAWSLKIERRRWYDSWRRVLLGLLTLFLLPAPKIDFLHCANGPYLAVWCLCYLSTVGSFSPFSAPFHISFSQTGPPG